MRRVAADENVIIKRWLHAGNNMGRIPVREHLKKRNQVGKKDKAARVSSWLGMMQERENLRPPTPNTKFARPLFALAEKG